MKISAPITWERILSQKGNNAVTWEELIKGNNVPYLALIRNLSNIIKANVKDEVIELVIRKLTDQF
jgi:telomerase protein component 1